MAVESNSEEGVGFGESLERTYNYRRRDLPGMPNEVGLAESLHAAWKVGNVIMERDIIAAEDIWETVEPVETDWEVV